MRTLTDPTLTDQEDEDESAESSSTGRAFPEPPDDLATGWTKKYGVEGEAYLFCGLQVSDDEAADVQQIKCSNLIPNGGKPIDVHPITGAPVNRPEVGDGTRRQSGPNPKAVTKLCQRAGAMLHERRVPHCAPGQAGPVNQRVLESVPLESGIPGANQEVHADAKEPRSLRGEPLDRVPYSGILAIQDGTRIRIRTFVGEWVTVIMQRGDVLIFRGDVCHYGVGYEQRNVRIHFYLDVPGVYREPNVTFGGC